MDTGLRLKELREAAAETRAKLAVAIGVHVTLVHKWEHGERYPSNRSMAKILKHYKLTAGEFYATTPKRKRKAA